ncbi:hypothetical protein Patl1_20888 [Pistacia atlantica]|uniref:Uncharacterized protein n=1 Tax=Pistacia atlantica TaxID=434234 RepID=A0ACC1BMA5_9ROSI|nr:hypothetical protein Patl1_20888 [Pistacia atlantica]
MAGLQYNFFPTDFFYPRASPPSESTAEKAALPSQQYYFFPTDYWYPRPQSVQVPTNQRVSPILKTDASHNNSGVSINKSE